MTASGCSSLRFKVSLVVCLVAGAGCGGGSSGPSAPSPPAPPAGSVPTNICSALGPSGLTAILNGANCDPGSSSVVLLNMRDLAGSARGACTGTVISPRAILTAAHCLTSDTGSVRVFLGSGAELPATSFTAHPAYSGGGSTADVGVVIMPQDLPRTPIPLLLSRDVRVGESAIIAGWGRNQNDIPATLRAGATTITGAGTILETQFGAQVSSVCSGDSGGPILILEGGVWSIGGVTSATSANICNTGTNFYVSLRNSSVSSFVLGLVPDARQR